jgi:hypothetical protein
LLRAPTVAALFVTIHQKIAPRIADEEEERRTLLLVLRLC